MSPPSAAVDPALTDLRAIIGARFVKTGDNATKPFREGYREGGGPCVAVLQPGSLVELWRTLKVCTRNDWIIIMQAANTGLTAGSTPQGTYDRPTVIISTTRLSGIHVLKDQGQVVCLPGATLHKLEGVLKPLGREPHSVIGSSCLGASVTGGVCNNSGGALVERGPSYTELSLYARIDEDGEIRLMNELEIDLGSDPEAMLHRLDTGSFSSSQVRSSNALASDRNYADWVRDIDATTPARYNADPRRLKGASGCAGKVVVFAVRLDTFPSPDQEQTFLLGANTQDALAAVRRRVLRDFSVLPVSAEYLHQDIFDLTEDYGRDVIHLIRLLGTLSLPRFFSLKARTDSYLGKMPFLPPHFLDRVLNGIGRILPHPLSRPMRSFASTFEHLLILKTKGQGSAEAAAMLGEMQATGDISVYPCSDSEASSIGLFRFAAAGAAIRYQMIKGAEVGALLPLDIALPRNTEHWFETLPDEITALIDKKLYYGHFLCHVFHQDYVLKPGTDEAAVKDAILELLEKRGAKYPAEHNVGHLYEAEPELAGHYRALDPTNQLNPGIGKQSRRRNYES
ncbi:MAG: D-lactate dehydrogenase [Pseudomonadota bacterium]